LSHGYTELSAVHSFARWANRTRPETL
jgi:hypothetical protein